MLAGIPLGAPLEDELRSRLDEFCRTIYRAFTAGYTPGAGPDPLRADLAGDEIPAGLRSADTFVLVLRPDNLHDAANRTR